MDAFGNLTKVVEPDASQTNTNNQATTTYTYDLLNHLTNVSMPRQMPGGNTVTQSRAFSYGGVYLVSTTNPESGTVSYTYNTDGTMATKTDAKAAQGGYYLQYLYDSYGRVTTVQTVKPDPLNNNPPTVTVLRTYTYDSNPFDPSYSAYSSGRLTAVQYKTVSDQFSQQYGFTGDIVTEMYSYTRPGQVAANRMRVARQGNPNLTADLNATWDFTSKNEGHLMGVTYPGDPNQGAVPSYTYTYDVMGRLNTMTDGNGGTVVNGTQYNAAGQMTVMGGFETRSYNNMGQLTNLNSYGPVNITYNYSATQNSGKITSQTDNLSGEQVTYLYDSLNRLTSATGAGWNQGFVYDPFGNLTDKNGTNSWHAVPDAATNHLGSVDANGNAQYSPGGASLTYDPENRLISSNNTTLYGYDAQNKRIWACTLAQPVTQPCQSETYYFYSPQGKLMAQFTPQQQGSTFTLANGPTRSYFGGRLLGSEDRLGSRGKYFPYGEDRSSPPPANDQVKFATYTRDSATGLDYANQRYYSSSFSRFSSPDPYMASGGPTDPGSWNRYAYTRGDPVNRFDPSGLQDEGPPMLPFFGYCPDGRITFYGASPCPPPTPNNLWGWNIGPPVIDLSGLLRLFLPKQVFGTNDQARKVDDAYVDALLKLNLNDGCHDALTSAGLDATTMLQDTTYRVLDLGMPGAGAETVDSSNVFINSAGAFFTAVPDATGHVTFTIPSTTAGGPSTAVTFLSQTSADAFILLHELGHQTGVFGPDAGPDMTTINAGNSWLVLDKCFGIRQPGH
jgi:RHS repeat-associated protein